MNLWKKKKRKRMVKWKGLYYYRFCEFELEGRLRRFML